MGYGIFVDFNNPTQVWRCHSKKCLGISRNYLYCQKLELLTYILAADSMEICSLVFTQLCLKVELSESQTASAKTEFYIATQGHSRSFILQSMTGRQRVSYRHIILLAIYLKFPKLPIQIAKHLQSSTTPLSFETPAKRNNRECAHAPYYFQKLRVIGLHFLSLIVWVYLHSNLCSGLQKMHLFCTRVLIGSLRSLKVIQGRWFWYQSKVHHCDYGPILHLFWDIG